MGEKSGIGLHCRDLRGSTKSFVNHSELGSVGLVSRIWMEGFLVDVHYRLEYLPQAADDWCQLILIPGTDGAVFPAQDSLMLRKKLEDARAPRPVSALLPAM